MLTAHVERYVRLRQTLGFKLRDASRSACARSRGFAAAQRRHPRPRSRRPWPGRRKLLRPMPATFDCGWWSTWRASCTPRTRLTRSHRRICFIAPGSGRCRTSTRPRRSHRSSRRLVGFGARIRSDATCTRRCSGLIAATGLRVSEALDLRLSDVLARRRPAHSPDEVRKDRYVPLHPTVVDALDRYLDGAAPAGRDRRPRVRLGEQPAHRRQHRQLHVPPRASAWRGLPPPRTRPPRIHDLRHTFATRALERCPTRREAVARHFVALATYLGHADIANTYWYLEATPELMQDIAAAAEALVAEEGA